MAVTEKLDFRTRIVTIAKPSTQTVPLNGTAATLNGSGSYATNPPVPITQWSWDFESDGTYDYTETDLGGGNGIAYKVYDKGGIFTVTLKATDTLNRYDTDTEAGPFDRAHDKQDRPGHLF